MGKRIVVDPISRIEGHLRIEVEIENGKVKDAWNTCTSFRGLELVLKGRDPRDAHHIAHRICGVCPTSHGIASAMSIEDSAKVKIPENARLVRNLMEGAQFLHSHILWFYHLNAFDYVDVVSALGAKPKTPALKKLQDKLKTFVKSGQLGILANGYWGHPEYKLPPELNLELTAHYFQALEYQAKAAKMLAVLGGKFPYHMTTPPGGVMVIPSLDQLKTFKFMYEDVKNFVDEVMVPDLLAVAPYILDWAKYGKSHPNFLAWGIFEDESRDPYDRLLPRGAIFGGELKANKVSPDEVKEYTSHSWYTDNSGGGRNPLDGVTEPKFTGIDTNGKYDWAKAVRLGDKPMEVGALSRLLVAYVSGRKDVQKLIDSTLAALGTSDKGILLTHVGRVAAKTLESKLIADAMEDWLNKLIENQHKNEWFTPYDMPDKAAGVGAWEAPRGALAHWNRIEGKRLKNYQCVPATNWNFNPRDDNGVRGPIEEALVGTPVADPKRPLEILRIVHSYDP